MDRPCQDRLFLPFHNHNWNEKSPIDIFTKIRYTDFRKGVSRTQGLRGIFEIPPGICGTFSFMIYYSAASQVKDKSHKTS